MKFGPKFTKFGEIVLINNVVVCSFSNLRTYGLSSYVWMYVCNYVWTYVHTYVNIYIGSYAKISINVLKKLKIAKCLFGKYTK